MLQAQGKRRLPFKLLGNCFTVVGRQAVTEKDSPYILADRNTLANQAFNSFSAFAEDAMVRITPKEIKKTGKVPTNGSLFFTFFQSLIANDNTAEEAEIEKGQ